METTVEYDLSVEQVRQITDPNWSGPLGKLARRMSANAVERAAASLAGPTRITVSDSGIRQVSAGSERRIDWAGVRAVNERTRAWMFQLAPSGLCMIPFDAVPASQLAELKAQLRAIAGAKYKVRDGGMPQG